MYVDLTSALEFVGDKMGLEAFLSDDEGLALNRSIGSVPWLFPPTCVEALSKEAISQSKPDQTPLVPTIMMKNESTLRVSLAAQTLHLNSLHNNVSKYLRAHGEFYLTFVFTVRRNHQRKFVFR